MDNILPFQSPASKPTQPLVQRKVQGNTRNEKLSDLLRTKTCYNWEDNAKSGRLTVYIETQAEADNRRGIAGAPREIYFLIGELDRNTDLVNEATRDIGLVLTFDYNIYFLSVGFFLNHLYFEGDGRRYAFFKEIYEELNAYPPTDAPAALISPKMVPSFDGIYNRTENNIRLYKQIQAIS